MASSSSFFGFNLFLFLDVFLGPVEEEIWHDIPVLGPGESTFGETSESEDFSGEKPPNETDWLSGFVVAWDSDIDVFQVGISITKCNNRDVNIRSLSDSLVIDFWIGDDQNPWLSVASLTVIREATWAESTGNLTSTTKLGKLDNSPLSHFFSRNNANVFWVFNSYNNPSSKLDFFPEFLHIENMGTGGSQRIASFVDILSHLVFAVGTAEVKFGS